MLRTHGPLTRAALYELVQPRGWHVPFEVALERAVDSGRVRPLGTELFEAGPAR